MLLFVFVNLQFMIYRIMPLWESRTGKSAFSFEKKIQGRMYTCWSMKSIVEG